MRVNPADARHLSLDMRDHSPRVAAEGLSSRHGNRYTSHFYEVPFCTKKLYVLGILMREVDEDSLMV